MRHFGFVIFILVLVVLSLYTAYKINQLTALKRGWSWFFAILVFAVMIGWQFLYRNGEFASHKSVVLVLAWLGSVVLGVWATFILFSMPYDLATLAAETGRKIFGSGPMDHQRRALFLHFIPAGILGFSGLAAAAGFKQALSGPALKEVDITVPGLPEELRGLKIVQITDFHVSPLIGHDYVESVVNMALSAGPDMIVLTGDLPDGTPESLSDSIAPLGRLKAPLGAFYVTGNHEYYWNADEWVSAASDLGFTPLMNHSTIVEYNNRAFLVGGVTDTSAGSFDPKQKSDPHRAVAGHHDLPFKLLLAHRPESCFEAEKAG